MPFGEAMDGGRGGNRYRRGRLGKTDNFYQIATHRRRRSPHPVPGVDHVFTALSCKAVRLINFDYKHENIVFPLTLQGSSL